MDTATRQGRGANADEPRCGANPAHIGYVGDGWQDGHQKDTRASLGLSTADGCRAERLFGRVD